MWSFGMLCIAHQSVPPLYMYSTYACNTAEHCVGIDESNEYDYKHPLVLSSQRQVTWHGVRSKSLNLSDTKKEIGILKTGSIRLNSEEIRKYGNWSSSYHTSHCTDSCRGCKCDVIEGGSGARSEPTCAGPKIGKPMFRLPPLDCRVQWKSVYNSEISG